MTERQANNEINRKLQDDKKFRRQQTHVKSMVQVGLQTSSK